MFSDRFLRVSVRLLVCLVTLPAFLSVTAAPADAQRMTPKQRQQKLAEEKRKRELNNLIAKKNLADKPSLNIEIAKVSPGTKQEVLASADKIDQLVEMDLARKGLKSNPISTDEQFVRRIYLDTVGTIPTGRRAWNFIRTKNSKKREILIDYLLNQPGYSSHMYNFWADILRVIDRVNDRSYIRPFAQWLKDSFRRNTSYDKMVYEMLTAEGKAWENPATGYKLRDSGMPLDNLNGTVRIFLGTRIGCAQCHDHPFDRWTQKEFYELAAFEAGVRNGVPPKSNAAVDYKMIAQAKKKVDPRKAFRLNEVSGMNRQLMFENVNQNLHFPKDYSYDNAKAGSVVKPNVIFGTMPKLDGSRSKRVAFAEWLTSKDNPRFAKTIANRMWKRLMGVGLIEPVDDLQDDTVATNPELLAFLESEIKRLDFDLKEFQRIIFHTRTYQRQVNYDGHDRTKVYEFVGPALRRMTAEQVWDSLLTLSLEEPDTYLRPADDVFVSAVKADGNTSVAELAAKVETLIEIYSDMRKAENEMYYKGVVLRRASELPQPLPEAHFLRQFGQSDRKIISDSNTEGTVPQLLTLFNGPVTHMMLEAGSVVYNELTSTDKVDDRIRIIFLSVLGRMPTEDEMDLSKQEYRRVRMEGYGNVVWALLNTREFLFVQ